MTNRFLFFGMTGAICRRRSIRKTYVSFSGIKLQALYEIPEELDKLSDLNELLRWVLLKSWLFFFHAKEWLAILAGKDHPLYHKIRGLGEKKSGYYLFEGFVKGENGLFRHLATDRVLEVSGHSMDYPADLVSGRSVIYAGFSDLEGMQAKENRLLSSAFQKKKIRGTMKQRQRTIQNK